MFEHLAKDTNRVILVTGPQRSGTTIASKMIAQDTGYSLVDETFYGVYDKDEWLDLVTNLKRAVIQCPHMMRDCVDEDLPDDVLVVVLFRNVADIVKSQRRIGWNSYGRSREFEKFPEADPVAETIARVKYRYFETAERKNRYFIQPYKELQEHPLWVDKPGRKSFGPKQTEK